MTSFGVVMAIYDKELPATEAVQMEVITYIGFAISLICVAIALLLFCCMRGLATNSITIHTNLAFVLFISNLVFIVGIDRVDPQLGCKFVTIALHYFYLSTFAWLFVEVLHLYRMITEIRDVNHGSMKFYYLLGYVIPGIIVCLAVGLNTEGYGENGKFCWLETDSLLVWSFTAPAILAVAMIFVVFLFAVRANCTAKKDDWQTSYYKYALCGQFLNMPVIGVTWVFGLLSVNSSEVPSFHYLFALLTCLQGILLLLGYVVLNKHTRKDLKHTLHKLQGKRDLDDSMSGTRTSMLSRSALAYHHNNESSSLDGGGLNRLNNVGISTTSTTSRSSTTADNSKHGVYPRHIPSSSSKPDGSHPYGYGSKSRGIIVILCNLDLMCVKNFVLFQCN